MLRLGDIGEWIHTGSDGGVSSFEWRIPDFLSLGGGAGDRYVSPFFDCCGGRWCLWIFPKGMRGNSPSEWVSLRLTRCSLLQPETLDVTLAIRGKEGVENREGRRLKFLENDRMCVWDEFCHREPLRQHASRLMPGNKLAIVLDMRRDDVARDTSTQKEETAQGQNQTPEKQDASTQTEESEAVEVATEGNESSDKRGVEKAMEDFGKLLASGENSDITLQLGNVEFKVHSAILFARCPALSVSLQHESKEKTSRKIVVEDCHPGAFRDFLHYLYTGSVQSPSEQIVFDLYRIADKYLAEDLKQHCLEHIRDTLSVETFCESVKLALTYGEEDLLEKAIDFAAKNIRSIVRSVQWQDFNREHPNEANEIIIKSLGPP